MIQKVQSLLGGHTVAGYADGTFITVARNNQMFTLQSGASGETSRSKSNDFSGTIELQIMQTSLTNEWLQTKATLDEVSNGGKFAVGLIDGNGTTVVTAVEAWVQQQPSTEFGKELSERTWIIETGELIMKLGGTI